MAKRANGEGTIRKRSDGRWEGRYFDPVSEKQRSVYAKTQKEVREKIAKVFESLGYGLDIDKSKMKTKEWFDIWMKKYNVNIKPLTYDAYSAIIKNHISPKIGEIPLCSLNTNHIQDLYNFLCDKEHGKGLSNKTLKNVHGVVHKALEQAYKISYIARNPSDACVLPQCIRKKITPMETDVIKQFLEAIKKDEYRDIYFVTLFTGMRQGEILGLKWDCVDLKNGCIKIKRQLQKRKGKGSKYYLSETSKNSKERIVYPAQPVMDVLKDLRKKQMLYAPYDNIDEWEEGLVFVDSNGKHLVPNTVYKHYKRIVEELESKHLRFHDLRHSFAVISLENGDNIKVVQEALGHHSSAFTLDTYAHTTKKAQLQSAQKMQSYINELQVL